MAQSGYTPIQLYYSSITTHEPSPSNLSPGELAINTYDGKLFYRDSSNNVQVIASKSAAAGTGTSTSILYGNGTGGFGNVTVGSGLSFSTGTLSATGTGTSTSILYGNGSGGFSDVTIGSGLTFAAGTLTATGSGGTVTSVGLSAPALFTVTNSPVTGSGTLTLTYSGSALPIANGGTNSTATPTAGSVAYGTGTAIAYTSAGTTGQILTSNGTGAPTWSTISPGSGTVTSVGMTVPTFLSVTPSSITSSGTFAVSLSGTALPVANGGTGQTSYTNGQLLIGNSTGNTLSKSTLTAGTGIGISNGAGSITITNSGVTSYPASGIAVSTGSAWTTSISASTLVTTTSTGQTISGSNTYSGSNTFTGSNAFSDSTTLNVTNITIANPGVATVSSSPVTGTIVIFKTGTLPSGLSLNVPYYWTNLSSTTGKFSLPGTPTTYIQTTGSYTATPTLYITNNVRTAFGAANPSGIPNDWTTYFEGTPGNPTAGFNAGSYNATGQSPPVGISIYGKDLGSIGGGVQAVYFGWGDNSSLTNVGTISIFSASTQYNTTSDYRLKENIAPMTGALDKVALLKPVTYKWKVNGSDGQGFIAHELQSIFPDAVAGLKDAVDPKGNPIYQGIDTSFLVATLTAAIQEQQAMIKSLESRISVLESK